MKPLPSKVLRVHGFLISRHLIWLVVLGGATFVGTWLALGLINRPTIPGTPAPHLVNFLSALAASLVAATVGASLLFRSQKQMIASRYRIEQITQIQAILQINEARLKRAQQMAAMGFWELDLVRQEYYFSETVCNLLELDFSLPHWKREEIRRRVHPDDRDMVRNAISEAIENERELEITHRFISSSGKTLYVREQGEIQRDSTGKAVRIFGTMLDITALMNAQHELRSEKEFSDRLIETAPAIVLVLDTEGRIIRFNSCLEQLGGYRLNEIKGMDWFRIFVPSTDQDEARQLLLNTATASSHKKSTILIARNGQQLIVEWNATSLTSNAGEATGVLIIGLDVTEQVRTESERDRLFNHSIDLLAVSGTDGFLKQVNPAWTKVTGWHEEDILSRLTASFIHPDDLAATETSREALKSGQPIEGLENRFLCRDGSYRWLSWNSFPLNEENLVFSVVRDVTEKKEVEAQRERLEAQMQQAQKMESLGVLAGGVAHDFSNLLMGILGNADLALSDLPPTSPARPCVQDIESAAKRAADLCRQMLAYSGKGKFQTEMIDLNNLIAEMSQLLKVSISKNANIQFSLSAHRPVIEADASQIRQVIMNLIINASEAIGSKSGLITLTTTINYCDRQYLDESWLNEGLAEGNYAGIEICDDGAGMTEETRKRIFDPFFSTKFIGRGLGLPAVLGIVRGHKGAIHLYSEPEHGTTFRILFPSAHATLEPCLNSLEISAHRPSSGATILLVDDEPAVRDIGSRLLQKLGFQVITASDGREAVDLFRRGECSRITGVLLDLTMPHMNGEETFRALKKICPSVPVILSSGYNEQEVMGAFSDKGLAGFIQKPYQSNELGKVLNAALGANEPATTSQAC